MKALTIAVCLFSFLLSPAGARAESPPLSTPTASPSVGARTVDNRERSNPCAIPIAASLQVARSPTGDEASRLKALSESLHPSIFQVATPSGTGTGFVFSPGGLALTALHVVETAEEISVRFHGRPPIPAELRLGLPELDLAVIALPAGTYPFLPLGDSDLVAIGNRVVAAGFPQTTGLSLQQGRIAGRIPYMETPLIEIDAALLPGYSGGPLLSSTGEVIGIVFSRCKADQATLTLSIPANVARARIPELFPSRK